MDVEGYLLNIPRLAARRKRRALELRPDVRLTPEQVQAMVLAETDDPEAAMLAAEQVAMAQLTAKTDADLAGA